MNRRGWTTTTGFTRTARPWIYISHTSNKTHSQNRISEKDSRKGGLFLISKEYVNYHKHDVYSNIILADSVATLQDYADRAKELGHTTLSSCSHGNAGNWKEAQLIAEANDLRFRYVYEAYFVKDRHEKDNTNAHLLLAAKTEKGIGDLNEAISESYISGFYYRPRIDLDILMQLDPRDVFCTTACVGGVFRYGYEEAEELIVQMHRHFGDSFMLEVQMHNTDKQKEVSQFLLKMYRKYKIPLIMGVDSHFIYPEQEALRDLRLEANGIKYEGEEFWLMDFPSRDTCVKQFQEQGILSDAQIEEAIDNTLVFLDFEDVLCDRSRKFPNVYPDLTQEQRNEKYRQLVLNGYERLYPDATPEQREKDLAELEYEMSAIVDTNTSDYFLSLVGIVDKARELGGVLTPTGRGSAASFATNRMLGLTSVNRLRSPVTLYPDRFISKDRLSAGSLPDVDLNCGSQDPFAEAGQAILGEWGCVPMVAFGKLGLASAWKMYARAENVPFDEANEVSSALSSYEKALLYARNTDDDDGEDEGDGAPAIRMADYVPERYLEQIEASKQYHGIVNSIAPHPCAYLILDRDIRREIGVVRLKSKGGNPVYGAIIDGSTAEKCGYVKSDMLNVDVVSINDAAYRMIGIEQPSAAEIIEITKDDAETWRMYAEGYTMALNQCEKPKTTERIKRYKPKNIVEMAAFVAAIRPSFQSMLEQFLSRRHFQYNIPALDEVLQTPEMKSSFIIYQEQIFTILMTAGISGPDAYHVIKGISRKDTNIIHAFMDKFIEGFVPYVMSDGVTREDEARRIAREVWQIVEDSAQYGFAAAHAYCVALDSLYSAYLKAHYPYEFYAAAMRVYGEKGHKDKIAKMKMEMRQAFGITVDTPKFGQDNRDFFIDKASKTIADALPSVKYMSRLAAEALYDLKDNTYQHFVDLLLDILLKGNINSRQIKILIDMGYFRDFGPEGKLHVVYEEFTSGKNRITKQLVPRTIISRLEWLRDFEALAEGEPMTHAEKLKFELEYIGAPLSVYPDKKGEFMVLEVDTQYSPKIDLYNAASGTTGRMKIRKQQYNADPLLPGDTIKLVDWDRSPAYAYTNGVRTKKQGEFDLWIRYFRRVS